jgi:hypothetical protein
MGACKPTFQKTLIYCPFYADPKTFNYVLLFEIG